MGGSAGSGKSALKKKRNTASIGENEIISTSCFLWPTLEMELSPFFGNNSRRNKKIFFDFSWSHSNQLPVRWRFHNSEENLCHCSVELQTSAEQPFIQQTSVRTQPAFLQSLVWKKSVMLHLHECCCLVRQAVHRLYQTYGPPLHSL